MDYIKKFEEFIYAGDTEKERTPTPVKAPPKPGTKPGPGKRPTPIRRDKPGVTPAPKAEKPKEATIEDVMRKYAELTDQKY